MDMKAEMITNTTATAQDLALIQGQDPDLQVSFLHYVKIVSN